MPKSVWRCPLVHRSGGDLCIIKYALEPGSLYRCGHEVCLRTWLQCSLCTEVVPVQSWVVIKYVLYCVVSSKVVFVQSLSSEGGHLIKQFLPYNIHVNQHLTISIFPFPVVLMCMALSAWMCNFHICAGVLTTVLPVFTLMYGFHRITITIIQRIKTCLTG